MRAGPPILIYHRICRDDESSRCEFVVTTSEFNKVKTQLAQLENRRPSAEEANKPSLRRKTQRPDVNGGDDGSGGKDTKTTSSKNKKDKDTQADSSKPDDKEPADDDRPKLKRRD